MGQCLGYPVIPNYVDVLHELIVIAQMLLVPSPCTPLVPCMLEECAAHGPVCGLVYKALIIRM